MFVWTKEYSVGVEEMDEQHQRFLELANEAIIATSEQKASAESLSVLIDQFLDYILYHLSSEEVYFDKFACQVPGHLEAHNLFRQKMKKFQAEALGEGTDVHKAFQELAVFAGNWLLEHILVMDKQYTGCFQEHGVK